MCSAVPERENCSNWRPHSWKNLALGQELPWQVLHAFVFAEFFGCLGSLRGCSLDLRHKVSSVLFQFICTFTSLKLVWFTTILNAACVAFSQASLMFQLWRSLFSTCIALCFFSTKFPFPKGYTHECVYTSLFLYVYTHTNLYIFTYKQIHHLN